MRCLKIPRRYLIYSFSFFAMFLSSFLLCSSSSYAADDLVFTLSSSQTSICSDWTSSYNSLCGYHYVILQDLSSTNRGTAIRCSFILPDNVHTFDLSSTYASFAILSPYLSSGLNYSSVTCRTVSSSASASVRMTLTDSYIPASPSGSITLSENGTYDVTNYAEAVVDIPPVPGDYHDDLVSIKISIIMCAGVLLVLYFFYCIYRLLIKSTGGWR